jgi:hypothetical protein
MNIDEIFREFLKDLYLHKKFLTNQKGQRRDASAPNYIQYFWGDLCEEIGISRQTADNWLHSFIWEYDAQPIRPSAPPGFAAAVWWSERKKELSAGKNKPAGKRRRA